MDGNEMINRALAQKEMKAKYEREVYGLGVGSIAAGGQGMSGGGQLKTCANMIREPSVADRIEDRMTRLQDDLDRLKCIKKQLSEPNGVLSMSQSDFEFLLRY